MSEITASSLEDTEYVAPNNPRLTPLPKLQISLLLLLQLAEPITTHTLFPFINELVSSLDVAKGDPHKAAYYVGMIESVFFVTESATILQWSRLSDHIGRKPVLLIGVTGLCISMLSFGLSRTLVALVISRSLAGLLCANAGVRKSMLGELTDSSNIGQGAALMPITWSFGATIGPFIGGTLSRPHDHFPETFSAPFWQKFPYFLPCAVSAMFSATVLFIASAFLKETVKKRRKPATSEEQSLLYDQPQEAPASLRVLLSHRVMLPILLYALLAIFGSASDALQSVLYATPVQFGGLGLKPSTIGLCLSTFGLINGLLQAFFFAKVVRWLGPKRLFIAGILAFVPIFSLFPVISLVARHSSSSTLKWAFLCFQLVLCVSMDMSYSCMFIFITSAAPKGSLGATNGLAQTAVAIARAIGPAMATSLFAFSMQHQLLGGYAVYGVLVSLVLLVVPIAMRLPTDPWSEPDTL